MVDTFLMYDIVFLILFSIGVFLFLRKDKKGLKREGWMYLYRTKWGIKAINYVGDTYKKTLDALKVPIVAVGLLLMAIMLWMLGQTLSIYILFPEITKIIKAPPVAPLIPYFPKLFGMESFFPPFYFTYFIIALAIVAIVHEFSHGIFMRRFKVKIKSTGLVFLGPILGAFVEEEKKTFEKKGNLEQMTILGAGVFANIIFALVFYGLYVAFFFSSFQAVGYTFDTYGISAVPLQNILGFEEYGNLTKVNTLNGRYYLDDALRLQLEDLNSEVLFAYPESPAVLLQIKGAITHIDNIRILNQDELRRFLEDKHPGDKITLKVLPEDGQEKIYSATLASHPENKSKAYLGVGNAHPSSRGFIRGFLASFMSFKNPSTYYEPTWDGEFVYFILHLLWWIMIINLLVALFNMLPLGILDGGRFFYLAVLSVSKSEKFAKRTYDLATYVIAAFFFFLLLIWFIRIV